jgi:hypothetical protein
MTIYLDGNAIAPGKVAQALDAYENPNDLARYTLRFNDIDHEIDQHGIVRDRGRFYAQFLSYVSEYSNDMDSLVKKIHASRTGSRSC